jgi:hypothetical protein
MDSGWIALAVAVVGGLIGWLVRSPKESMLEIERRVATLEGTINQLSRDYAGVHGRHDEALKSLTLAVTRLTDRFDQYMGTVNGHSRRGG